MSEFYSLCIVELRWSRSVKTLYSLNLTLRGYKRFEKGQLCGWAVVSELVLGLASLDE